MRLHHLRLSCQNVDEAKRRLAQLYSLHVYGYMVRKENEELDEKIEVLRHNDMFFMLRKAKNFNVDTIDDIAFCVDSLSSVCSDIDEYGGRIIEEPHVVTCKMFMHSSSYKGCKNCTSCDDELPCLRSTEKTVVKSTVGNLQHTLLRKNKDFNGEFLPGFVRTGNREMHDKKISNFECIDHIALAVPCSETIKHVNWYRQCLKLLKFKCNKLEKETGLVIKSNNGRGLRLFTLVEHPCSNEVISEEVEVGNDKVKLVFCESLTEEGTDQIQNFLDNHSGSGVQHVAFKSNAIIEDTEAWHRNGVEFLSPPIEYYQIINSALANLEDETLVNSLQDLGILVDVEKTRSEGGKRTDGYLYQVFTKPVFPSQTFFFEIIQRDRSFGFGTGNVSALWNAVDLSLNGSR